MSEYLRIVKKNKKQLENSSFILIGNHLTFPTITQSDIKKIFRAAKKKSQYL